MLKSMNEFVEECNIHFNGVQGINVDRMKRINQENYRILLSNTSQFIVRTLKNFNSKITEQLSNWKGIKKSKKIPKRFRDYFKIARNTFDQRKLQIMVDNLWIPIIRKILEFTTTCADQVFSSRLFKFQYRYNTYFKYLVKKYVNPIDLNIFL